MQTMLLLVATIAIAVVAVAFVVLVTGILRETRHLGRAAQDLSLFLKTAEEEIVNTAQDARSTLRHLDQLALEITETTERIDNVAKGLERLLDVAHLASAAAKVTRSSSVGLASVYEGIKQGIKALYESHQTNKGGPSNE